MNKQILKKILTISVAAALLSPLSLYVRPFVSAEDETEASETLTPDDPDDGIVSINESHTDLLNEVPANAPSVTGTSYILYDTDSDTVLLGKNIDQPLEPASVTKVMTVLLAIENLDPEEIITITPEMYYSIPEDYQMLGVTSGEQVAVKDLIYASMLLSANDAALALAIHMGGTERDFCNMMNERAAELGCKHTHFTTAYGYADVNNTTSAYDMALIFEEAISHPDFCKIATTYQYTMEPTNIYSDTRNIVNLNRFISTQEYSYDYYIGGKTGHTETAGFTLAAGARKNDRTLVGVILGSTNSDVRYLDMINMFECGFTSFSTIRIDPTEFDVITKDTINQINSKLIDTNLKVMENNVFVSDYLTTTSSRIALGCTGYAELSKVRIDPTLEEQTFEIPLCKRYADGKTYQVGHIHIVIATKDKVIELTPEKASVWTGLKKILIGAIAVVVLILILLYSIVVYRRKLKRRAEDEYRRRSRML